MRTPVLKQSSEFAEWELAISPDGKQVAYAWYIERDLCDLRIIGLDGSEHKAKYYRDSLSCPTFGVCL